ncbi:MAG: carbohydrate-binding domain-containing protein [Lachnospiraceae bacterium]
MFDGIHAENTDDSSKGFVYLAGGTFDIASQQDGISASAWLQADDGTYTILTGAGGASWRKTAEKRCRWNLASHERMQMLTSIKGN